MKITEKARAEQGRKTFEIKSLTTWQKVCAVHILFLLVVLLLINCSKPTGAIVYKDEAGNRYAFKLANNEASPSSLNPFLLESGEDLNLLGRLIEEGYLYAEESLYAEGNYRLENSLDLGSTGGYTHRSIGTCKTPCDDRGVSAFAGDFDGNGKSLRNLTFEGSGFSVGLFGVVKNATISNVRLEKLAITNNMENNNASTGGLVGYAIDSRISAIAVRNGTVQGYQNVGGLVGYAKDTILTELDSTLKVVGQRFVGGLIGKQVGGEIKKVATRGLVTGGNEVGGVAGMSEGRIIEASVGAVVRGGDNIGGLVGLARANLIGVAYTFKPVLGKNKVGGLVGWQESGMIIVSYATGAVTGSYDQEDEFVGAATIGGLVGRQDGNIIASYATGDVNGSARVGGLVGDQRGGNIIESYAIGSVTGTSQAGGLVGSSSVRQLSSSDENMIALMDFDLAFLKNTRDDVDGTFITNENNDGYLDFTEIVSYWNIQTSGMGSSAFGERKTSTELKVFGGVDTIYAGWNASGNYWDFQVGDYPVLGVMGLPPTALQRRDNF